jgi:uncharacterized protein DUF6152
MKLGTLSLAVIVTAAFAAPAFAHHSFAMFDSEKLITYKGTVKQLEWTNPHSWLRVMITDQNGTPREWGLEMGPPARQIQRGWKPDSLRPGDTVTVDIHPLRDGSRGGQLVSAVLPDGKRVGGAGAPNLQE